MDKLRGSEDEVARRHAKAILCTAGLFVGAVVAVTLACLTAYPSWAVFAGPCILAGASLVPLTWGPRYVGVVMLLAAGSVGAASWAARAAPAAFWYLEGLHVACLFAMALWPLLERQHALNKADVLGPWAVLLAVYLGFGVAFISGNLSWRAMLGARNLVGLLLLVHACTCAWRILRGPREALMERGFPVREGE